MNERKLQWCFTKAEKEGRKHRGLRRVIPNIAVSDEHIKKAEHNLAAMKHNMNDYPDWAINASFYAQYHCLLAFLQKHGYESRNQECTFAAIEALIEQGKIGMTLAELHRIFATDQRDKLETADVVELRERFQYGTETRVEDKAIMELFEETKVFIERAKVILQETE